MNTPFRIDWTPEMDSQLLALLRDGLTHAAVVARLGAGITRGAVIGRAHRLRIGGEAIPPRGTQRNTGRRTLQWTGEHDAKLRGYHAAGLPLSRVAQAFAVKRDIVLAAAERLGLRFEHARSGKDDRLRRAIQRRKEAAAAIPASASSVPLEDRFKPGFLGQEGRVAFLDIAREGQCRFPIEIEGERLPRYCGAEATGTYCDHHAARCQQPVRPFVPRNYRVPTWTQR